MSVAYCAAPALLLPCCASWLARPQRSLAGPPSSLSCVLPAACCCVHARDVDLRDMAAVHRRCAQWVLDPLPFLAGCPPAMVSLAFRLLAAYVLLVGASVSAAAAPFPSLLPLRLPLWSRLRARASACVSGSSLGFPLPPAACPAPLSSLPSTPASASSPSSLSSPPSSLPPCLAGC